LHDPEGPRSEIENQQKEDLDRGDDDGGVGEKSLIGLVTQAKNEAVSRQKQRPEQQRAFLSRPEDSEFVSCGKIAIAVMKNVGDREIVVAATSTMPARSTAAKVAMPARRAVSPKRAEEASFLNRDNRPARKEYALRTSAAISAKLPI